MRQTIVPALRGKIGDWIFYSCLISLREVADRVHYAHEIHESRALSELIQRVLEGPRARHIAQYLRNTPGRFFSSLVLATYDGSPEWLELGNLRSTNHPELLDQMSSEAKDAIGFLRLSGTEKIFALDGQHRLAGIKQALADTPALGEEVVSVLLVGHRRTNAGMQRTRRLFTTLNKTAKPVKKDDIIALDEDDVMAIVARRLVENDERFMSPKIAVIASSNLPSSNQTALTSITNLYDVLRIVFEFGKAKERRDLRFNRPNDDVLDEHYAVATSYFSALAKAFPAVKAVMSARRPSRITPKWRNENGGHLLFRPLGLEVFTRNVVAYARAHEISLAAAVNALKHIPVDLAEIPYKGVIWDGRLNPKGKVLARRLIAHMAGLEADTKNLLADYRSALGVGLKDASVELPSRVV